MSDETKVKLTASDAVAFEAGVAHGQAQVAASLAGQLRAWADQLDGQAKQLNERAATSARSLAKRRTPFVRRMGEAWSVLRGKERE